MGLYIGINNLEDIDKVYDEFAEQVKADAKKDVERLKKRFDKFKEIEFDQIEDVIKEEAKGMTSTDLLGPMDLHFRNKYIDDVAFNRVTYDKAKKDHYDALVQNFDADAEEEREMYIFRNTKYSGPEQYFMANNMTKEQINEFFSLYYAKILEDRLSDARIYSAALVRRRKHKLSRNLDEKHIKDSLLIYEDIDEIKKMGEIGTVERIEVMNERQKRKQEDIKRSINRIPLPPTAAYIAGGYLGAYISSLLSKFTGNTEDFGFIGAYIIGVAAAHVLLKTFGEKYMSDEAKINEAKKLGIYDAIVRAKEARIAYNNYKKSIMEQYNIEEEVKGRKM